MFILVSGLVSAALYAVTDGRQRTGHGPVQRGKEVLHPLPLHGEGPTKDPPRVEELHGGEQHPNRSRLLERGKERQGCLAR